MKKKLNLLSNSKMVKLFLWLFLILSMAACFDEKKKITSTKETKVAIYTCPMHPEIREHKPGQCPICGMDLELVKDSVSQIEITDLIKPRNQNIISSIELVKPLKKEISVVIQSNGVITYNTDRLLNISSLFSGRIQKLYVKSNFQLVKKGDKLFDIYSPDMLADQQNLLFLLENKSDTYLINATIQKLMLLGMSNEQISSIEKSRKPLTIFSIFSDFDGYLLKDSSMVLKENKEISVEGSYISKGQTILKFVNTELVWVVLKIYEKDIAFVSLGQEVKVLASDTNSSFAGTIDFIEPIHEMADNWQNVRINVKNENQEFKIGQLVIGEIRTKPISGLWVPKSAMIDLGMKRIVFVKDKLLVSKSVEIGAVSDQMVQIVSGVDENTEIALNAQYLIDSESFIKAKENKK